MTQKSKKKLLHIMRDPPKKAYRYFKKRKYAISFMGGVIRLGHFHNYHTADGARQDKSEGVAYYVNRSGIPVTESLLNHVYLLCMCGEGHNQELAHQFGEYCVCISDVHELYRRIHQKLHHGFLYSALGLLTYDPPDEDSHVIDKVVFHTSNISNKAFNEVRICVGYDIIKYPRADNIYADLDNDIADICSPPYPVKKTKK